MGASQQRAAPGPVGLPLVGSALDLQRRGQLAFYLESWRAYGDVVRFRVGPFVAHILAHPDHIHHVLASNAQNYPKGPTYAKLRLALGSGLTTSEGELWRRERRLLQPRFTRNAVQCLGAEMVGAIDELLADWEAAAASERALVMNREMASLSLTILVRTIFSSDFEDVGRVIPQAATEVGTFLNRRLASFLDIPISVPTPANRRFRKALRTLDTAVHGVIQGRRLRPDHTPDLLGALLMAQDDETNQPMSDHQIRDEVITLLFAGHETIALALTWTWYVLAREPRVEDRLQSELDATLAGRTPTLHDLDSLPYTRMVIEEGMRLYPPVWSFPRSALGDDEIGGYHIPAGSLMLPSQFLAHRHPDFWERPDAFDPERFSPSSSMSRARDAYFPFGDGPRGCMGIHFAMAEMCLVVAAVAQRFRLRLLPGPPIEPTSMITLHPSRDVLMMVETR